ncbi:subtype B tannase [Chishuiella sp.]|uniref:subtype B tannase n=1 Tax=Chishuiella sp. TaxID=1969467 RepID=UPI0028B111D5|nr:subtype B tannase [Chishuiella sp.]
MKKFYGVLGCLLTSMPIFAQQNNKLKFDPTKYVEQTLEYNNKKIKVRAFENIVYVSNPVDTAYQKLNVYIPEEYFQNKSIGTYNTSNAPIFFPNQVGGYMPAKPATFKGENFVTPINGGVMDNNTEMASNDKSSMGDAPSGDRPMEGGPRDGRPPMGGPGRPRGGRPGGKPDGGKNKTNNFPKRENTVLAALAQGYVVISAGARGRTNVSVAGVYYGKAPAALVDLKAAVRYIKFNDAEIPGDANKIISNGTSAGGAISALLGATGDNPDYLPYLKAIGAAETSDAIFASSDYCPITNLEHADAAYEWQFNGINSYVKSGPFGPSVNAETSSLTSAQKTVSKDLKAMFPEYVNSLKLKDSKGNILTLDKNGNGNFKDYIKSIVIESANKAIKEGTDLSNHSFLTVKNNVVIDLNWDNYIKYMQRQKTPPAFDALDLSSAENIEFGTEKINAQHFTDYSQKNTLIKESTKADENNIKLLNPMNYIGTNNTILAKHFRIRHGAKDKDTGLAISAILALYLKNHGVDVDYALPWDRPHSGDYDLTELFNWIDSISE